ncbi:zinc finger protein 862-like [Saccostrea cucullata]|uniref:zinc finger protein 862-like n=1 Tax=Saccostrea cuccullata TaxID=36930 RepID=UPI002ED0813C
MEKIEQNGLLPHMPKIVGFGCDWASNMFGDKNGLVTLLKKDHPEMIAVHCLAHRLELAFKDTFKADKLFVKLTTLLLGLFYFYKNSPKQRKNLRKCMEVINISGTLPHRVSGSRWMPHMKKALQTLFKTYPAFISHLQNESHSNPKAEGLVKMLEDCTLMTYAAFL